MKTVLRLGVALALLVSACGSSGDSDGQHPTTLILDRKSRIAEVPTL